jgi:hypothetical protein
MPNEYLFSYIMPRTSFSLKKWWWLCPLCTRQSRLTGSYLTMLNISVQFVSLSIFCMKSICPRLFNLCVVFGSGCQLTRTPLWRADLYACPYSTHQNVMSFICNTYTTTSALWYLAILACFMFRLKVEPFKFSNNRFIIIECFVLHYIDYFVLHYIECFVLHYIECFVWHYINYFVLHYIECFVYTISVCRQHSTR